MDSQELRNLQEAYMEVVENQQLDEGYKDLPKKKMTRAGLKHAGRAAVLGAISTAAAAADDGNNTVSFDDSATKLMHKGQKSGNRALKIAKTRLTHSPQKAQEKSARNKARGIQKEQVDLYDIILSHLLDEGYAETPEAAEAIMVNMSEEWRESILG